MRRTSMRLAIGALALSVAAPAIAADMITTPAPYVPPAVPVSTTYDWSGLYIGGHAGYFFGNSDVDFPSAFGPAVSTDPDGFAGGAQIGYNWQIDQFLIGGEADISWADIQGSTGIANGTVSTRADWLSTVRARAGVAIDRVLIYGTGGIAFTDMKTELNGPVGFSSDSQNLTGWTIGAGVELALTENLSMKGEYLYTDFGDKDYGIGGTTVPVSLDGSTVRLGLNYRLNLF